MPQITWQFRRLIPKFMVHGRKSALQKLRDLIECKWYKFEKKMNHKNTENTCHGAVNMPFFDMTLLIMLAVLLHTENMILSMLQY